MVAVGDRWQPLRLELAKPVEAGIDHARDPAVHKLGPVGHVQAELFDLPRFSTGRVTLRDSLVIRQSRSIALQFAAISSSWIRSRSASVHRMGSKRQSRNLPRRHRPTRRLLNAVARVVVDEGGIEHRVYHYVGAPAVPERTAQFPLDSTA